MPEGPPDFRPGNLLTTRFTGTLTERYGAVVERLPTPARLLDWMQVNALTVGACTTAELGLARDLREAIHVTATAVVTRDPLPGRALDVINTCSSGGRATASLTTRGARQWLLGPEPRVEDALSVIAADAIMLLAGDRDGRLALCASPTCRAVFFDTSQSHTRRWCDMNTCGNREKKARFRAGQRSRAGAGSTRPAQSGRHVASNG